MPDKFEVSELFVSMQGEGPRAGTPSVFFRTRRCNLQCSWCDTRYTWDQDDPGYSEYQMLAPSDAAHFIDLRAIEGVPPHFVALWERHAGRVKGSPAQATNLVITGGEPLIWRRQLRELVGHLNSIRTIEIETNGTIPPPFDRVVEDTYAIQYNVSPKLPSAGNAGLTTWIPRVLEAFTKRNSVFKFVVSDEADAQAVTRCITELGAIGVRRRDIWLMPEGRSVAQLLDKQNKVQELAERFGLRVTQREHILAFGDEPGT